MRTNVERLRIWLVAGAGGLALVVAGFLVFAHYRSMLFKAKLPGKMAADILRDANGYTFSPSVEGRTVFTLHAASVEQRKDGLMKLHQVGIVMYGRKHDRTDRIYGNEFEYDEAKGIVRGIGEVHMDLQAPTPAAEPGKPRKPSLAADGHEVAGDAKMVHVLTSGVVYLINLGVAATSEDVEFAEGAMKGWSHGAEYNSDSGVLILQSAVRVNGLTSGGPVVVTATHAEWNKDGQMLDLTHAKGVTTEETVDAERALLHLSAEGTPKRLEASGSVSMTRAAGGVLTAPKADVSFGTNGKARDAVFGGGVVYADDETDRHARGQSHDAHVTFNAEGLAERVLMTGGAEIAERERGAPMDPWSTRNVTGNSVDVALTAAPGKVGKREIRDAEANGAAHVLAVTEATGRAPGMGTTRTEMSGDDLKAHFLPGNQVSTVAGTGHTILHQVNAAGVDEVSSGDTTNLVFRPIAGKAKALPSKGGMGVGAVEPSSAVQVGHVITVRKHLQLETGITGGALIPVEERSIAERADFDADTDRVTLTGGVRLSNMSSTIWGGKIVVVRSTGDAVAEGGVRVNYAQAGKDGADGEPVHVLADHADLKRAPLVAGKAVTKARGAPGGAGDKAFFYGTAAQPARLWQGTSQIQAPVLEFEQGIGRLTANGPGAGMLVHTVLVGSGKTPVAEEKSAVNAGAKVKPAKAPSVVRIASHELVYTEQTREAVFSGGVVVQDADGSIKSQKTVAYLAPADAKAATPKATEKAKDPFLGGGVDRVVATGKVEIDQPGRHGTGEQLVYTAKDQMFVLTGVPGAPPRMDDAEKGTMSGEVMTFHTGDDRVVVSGGGIEKHVRTETRVKQ